VGLVGQVIGTTFAALTGNDETETTANDDVVIENADASPIDRSDVRLTTHGHCLAERWRLSPRVVRRTDFRLPKHPGTLTPVTCRLLPDGICGALRRHDIAWRSQRNCMLVLFSIGSASQPVAVNRSRQLAIYRMAVEEYRAYILHPHILILVVAIQRTCRGSSSTST
jgi:hypothetical protein